MGFFDKAKAALGLGGGAPKAAEAPQRGQHKDGRPPLRDVPKADSGGSLDDALAARDAGKHDEARAILAAIDRGKGLRTVLRAAAALEARDEAELEGLLPAIRASEPAWTLALQVAAALEGAPPASSLVTYARQVGAPAWALAWTRSATADADERRRGMVDLLFADPALARTVAARDWKVDKAADDRASVERYAGVAHGRDAIRRFGAAKVAELLSRARPDGSAPRAAEKKP